MLLVLNQSLSQPFYSVEEYLALEKKTGMRYEYYNGKLRPMPGGTQRHSQIEVNLTTQLHLTIRANKKRCKVFSNDLKIAMPDSKKYLYPDAVVCCGEAAYNVSSKTGWTTNPLIIFEVLSRSTSSYDTGEKFGIYQQLESFKEYVIIHQTKKLVEVRTFSKGTSWSFAFYKEPNDMIKLQSLGIELSLEEIYYDIITDEDETNEVVEIDS